MSEADKNGWLPIETAPKDGTVILVYSPGGIDVDDHVYAWPDKSTLNVVPACWNTPDSKRSDYRAGWFVPWFFMEFGPYDDPSMDIIPVAVDDATHWRPLPDKPVAP